VLETELTANIWPGAAADAIDAFRAAIGDAKRLRLPLVVNS
jgi:hypothetical protein